MVGMGQKDSYVGYVLPASAAQPETEHSFQ